MSADRTRCHTGEAAGRVSPALVVAMLAIALFCSSCCSTCCRACAAGGSGSGSGGGSSGTGPAEAPESGSVASLITQRVGNYTLLNTAPVTRLGSGLSPGVIDSIGAIYTGPGGVQVNQILLAYASTETAKARMETVYLTLSRECPGKRLMRSNVTNRQGVIIGIQVVCDQSPQHVYWSNGRMLTFVTATHPHALQFYHASSY